MQTLTQYPRLVASLVRRKEKKDATSGVANGAEANGKSSHAKGARPQLSGDEAVADEFVDCHDAVLAFERCFDSKAAVHQPAKFSVASDHVDLTLDS